jgi:hypothetical protein
MYHLPAVHVRIQWARNAVDDYDLEVHDDGAVVAPNASLGTTDDAGTVSTNDRWLLIERNVGGSTPPHWVTSHESQNAAGHYHTHQEYARDWEIVELIDLDTGDRFEEDDVVVTFARVEPS